MTVPSATSRTNEAAERLMGLAVYVEKYDLDMVPVYEGGVNLLDAALSEERRLTVERLIQQHDCIDPDMGVPCAFHAQERRVFLDREAEGEFR